MRLEEALRECTLALLRRIAAAHDLAAGEDLLRSELSELIAAKLTEPGRIAASMTLLPTDERAVLAYLSTHEWQGKAFLLERQFSRPANERQGLSACVSLLQKGLLYRSYGVIESWRGELYHVPEEIRGEVGQAAPREDVLAVTAVRPAAEPAQSRERRPAYDAFCLLSYLRRSDRRSHHGPLHRRDIAELEQECSVATGFVGENDFEKRWSFLLRLCMSGGWVRRDGTFLRPGRRATQLLSGAAEEVEDRLLDRYLKDRSWSDLSETGRLRQPLGSRRMDETAARQMTLHYLEEIAGMSWISEADFCDALHARNPDFLRENYASLASAVVDVDADAEVYGADSWERVEAEWLRFVLRGPFFWLGVVRRGARAADGHLVQLRRRRRGPLVAQASSGISFADGYTIQAAVEADLDLLYRLEPYLLFRGPEPGRRVYRVTGPSVHHGIDSGGTGAELLDLVCRAGADTVAPTLVSQVKDWADSYGTLVLEGAFLLTAASEDGLSRLLGTPGIAGILGEQLGPLSRRVAPQRFWQLLSALREAGYPPRVDPSAGSVRSRGLTGDIALVRECLFALMLGRALHGDVGLEDSGAAIRILQSALGPEESEDVARQVQETARRLKARGERAW